MSIDKRNSEFGDGYRWRVLAHSESKVIELENEGVFDEAVVDDWFHLEHMTQKQWWLRVGDARILVSLEDAGIPRVDIERGFYGDVRGDTKDFQL